MQSLNKFFSSSFLKNTYTGPLTSGRVVCILYNYLYCSLEVNVQNIKSRSLLLLYDNMELNSQVLTKYIFSLLSLPYPIHDIREPNLEIFNINSYSRTKTNISFSNIFNNTSRRKGMLHREEVMESRKYTEGLLTLSRAFLCFL